MSAEFRCVLCGHIFQSQVAAEACAANDDYHDRKDRQARDHEYTGETDCD